MIRWDLQPNPISQLLAAKRARGERILDLTESNPTKAGLLYPELSLEISGYDPNPAGLLSAREAIYASPERVILTASTSEAYAFLFKLLTDPGDEVLVPRPSYPLFEFLAGMEHVRTVPYSLVYNGGWEIDFDNLTGRVTQRTRALVLVNPNNPTGSFLRVRELASLIGFCRDRRLAIVSDEVFSEYGFGEDTERVTSLRHVADTLTFCLSGLSKSAGLPQVKLGWMIVNGPDAPCAEAMARLELIADTYLSVGTPVQAALPKLLDAGKAIRTQIRARTARNLAALKTAIGPDSPFRLLNVEGGWYATLQAPRIRSEEEWILELLGKRNVLAQPGFFYDFETEAFLILSLLAAESVFDQGVEHILNTA